MCYSINTSKFELVPDGELDKNAVKDLLKITEDSADYTSSYIVRLVSTKNQEFPAIQVCERFRNLSKMPDFAFFKGRIEQEFSDNDLEDEKENFGILKFNFQS